MYTTTSNIPKFCDLPMHHVLVISQANSYTVSTNDNINKVIKRNVKYTLRQYNKYLYRLKNIAEKSHKNLIKNKAYVWPYDLHNFCTVFSFSHNNYAVSDC